MDLTAAEQLLAAFAVVLLVFGLVQSQRISTLKDRVDRLERSARPQAPSGVADLPPDVEHEVRQIVASGKKILAIKVVRERTGLGLKEAKDLVERL